MGDSMVWRDSSGKSSVVTQTTLPCTPNWLPIMFDIRQRKPSHVRFADYTAVQNFRVADLYVSHCQEKKHFS